ncbi:twin-arginine translocase subunit TatC [Cohnella nanjingensis]|uniref:Sec-independent protein translocase protein TatC n=1 Tax=Cohnella nanjingensis TaxID=1387779 RepID=A0A7X0RX55_9BACL|nr:twin-arginine translocase subunit TatC [Cohnella nanjingensis]MBB6673980.1 twin-arginine translocase subunit TatC [Cohnella nanjingensis]
MTDRSGSGAKIRDADWMPVMEHIGELRKRVIYVLIVFILGVVGGLFGAQPLFDYLVAAAPTERIELSAFSPWDAIGLYMKFAFLISFVVAIPFALFQLWAFVRPALGVKEQKATLRYVPGALVMFLAGLTFAYYVVFPMAYSFTEKITQNMGLKQTYGVAQYFSFLFNILVPMSVLFELPIVILFLTRIGILHPNMLRKMRKIAWFTMAVIGTVVTPPDVISDLLVAVPLVILYEVSVLLSSMAFRKRMERQRAWEEEEDEDEEEPDRSGGNSA